MDDTEKKFATDIAESIGFAVASSADDYGVWVKREYKGNFIVTLNGMYESDFRCSDANHRNYGLEPFSFKTLQALSEVFKTKNINIGQPECHGEGCESCGYNGFWGLKIWVHDVAE